MECSHPLRPVNRPVIEKVGAVFESYWEQSEFEPYDPGTFHSGRSRRPRRTGVDALSPLEVRLEPFQERLLEQLTLARQHG